jgi:hypothetical protein
MKRPATRAAALACLALSLSLGAFANAIQDNYGVLARQENPAFTGFSALAGRALYTTQVETLSCASCHTDSPMAEGYDIKTKWMIFPLAPSVNARRLTDAANVEKWFNINCTDVFKRNCTAQEKGDFMAYLISR